MSNPPSLSINIWTCQHSDGQTGGWTESEINGEKMEKKSLCVCLCRQHKNKSIEVSVFKYMVHNIFNYRSVYIQKAVDLP